MSVDAIYVAKSFYALEALRYLVNDKAEFGKHSHEKLIEDIEEYRDRFVSKLSTALLDYTALVIFGEMRHGWGRSTHYNPYVPQHDCREASYNEAKRYNPISILLAGRDLFKVSDWEENYGGEKWHFIADRVLLKDKLDVITFCDMCFSLSHNSSPYLDKYQSNIFKISRGYEYKGFLDYKFSCNDPYAIVSYCASCLGNRLLKLVERAMNLGLIYPIYSIYDQFCHSSRISANIAEDFIYNYRPVEWKNETLPNEVVQHRETLDDYSGYSLPEFREDLKKKQEILDMLNNNYCSFAKFMVGQKVQMKYDHVEYSELKKGMVGKITDIYDMYDEVEYEIAFDGIPNVKYYDILQSYLEKVVEDNYVEEKEAC